MQKARCLARPGSAAGRSGTGSCGRFESVPRPPILGSTRCPCPRASVEAELAERLAARTLELIDIPSRVARRGRARRARGRVLRDGGAEVVDLGDTCVLARRAGTRPRCCSPGHLDTVPAQGNLPGRDRRRARARARRQRHEGRARRDDRAGARAARRTRRCSSAARSCRRPRARSTPLLERAPAATAELVVVMEPTDNELHAGCLGQHQRHVDVPRALRALRAAVAGRQRDPPRGARRSPRSRARRARRCTLRRADVLRGRLGDADRRRDRRERDPRTARPRTSTTATRPAAAPDEAEARLHELCRGRASSRSTRNAPSGAGRRPTTRSRAR